MPCSHLLDVPTLAPRTLAEASAFVPQPDPTGDFSARITVAFGREPTRR